MDTASPGALQVADGTYYEPLNFLSSDVKPEIIAHQLALKCRWNGNTNCTTPSRIPVFYSVAQHSCIVHDIALKYKELFVPGAVWELEQCPSTYGLFHDAGEAPYLDVPRPLKAAFPALAEPEKAIKAVMLETLGIPVSAMIYECVRRIDNAMIFWERDVLMGQPVAPYMNEFDHPTGTIYDWVPDFRPWSPVVAKHEFLSRYLNWQEGRDSAV
jgi:hypothetical protein